MPIKGLTDRAKMDLTAQGRHLRIGYLQKGEKYTTQAGKQGMRDLEYFKFKPTKTGHERAVAQAFTAVYGEQPKVIGDVRLPHSISGNFDMASHAWLTASRHGKKTSLFMARSDGEWIRTMRLPSGKIAHYEPGELAHEAVTAVHPKSKKEGLKTEKGNFEWKRVMQLDFLLTDLNEELFRRRIGGLGVVTFITHSTYDIANLLDEYQAILANVAGVFSNPMIEGDLQQKMRWVPLMEIGLQFSRTLDNITTPAFDGSGGRQADKRWLCHLQLNAATSQALHQARQGRTAALLQHIAGGGQVGQLAAGDPVHDANEALGLPTGPKTAVADRPAEPESPQIQPQDDFDEEAYSEYLEDVDDVVEGEIEDPVGPEPGEGEPAPWEVEKDDTPEDAAGMTGMGWYEFAMGPKVSDFDGLASAFWQHDSSMALWFDDAAQVRLAFEHICPGRFYKTRKANMWRAIGRFCSQVADGVSRGAAAKNAREWYAEHKTDKDE